MNTEEDLEIEIRRNKILERLIAETEEKRKRKSGILNEPPGDLTDDDNFSHRSSYHIPQGSTSPVNQGRSVREFEEQMATLRKENFNLKLRLYFMEERMPGYQSNSQESQESLLKQLIDSKVEMEVLRKQIVDKQEVLKEAAAALEQMERIQKETESKSAVIIHELQEKVECMEMEREHGKTNSELMSNLIGHANITENLNALQRINELECMAKLTEEKIFEYENKVQKLEDLLAKSEQDIKEYEDKVKELAFQNAELLEGNENKDKEIATINRALKMLEISKKDLKEENDKLIETLKSVHDKFEKEITNVKDYQKQMQDQESQITNMQSSISTKTANAAVLIERIQDYEKIISKVNFERNLAQRENRFFRSIITKLQRSQNECFLFRKEEIYREQVNTDFNRKSLTGCFTDIQAQGDFQNGYNLGQKIAFNFSNDKLRNESDESSDSAEMKKINYQSNDVRVEDFSNMSNCCNVNCDYVPQLSTKYNLNNNLYDTGCSSSIYDSGMSKSPSCSSLQANFSESSLFSEQVETNNKVFLKEQQKSNFSALEDFQCLCSKFGNFR